MIDARANDLIARGDELMNSGDVTGALDQYEQAMTADPANGEAVAGLASALGELGRRDEGVERLHLAAGAHDWDTQGLVWLARGLRTLDQADQARELVRKATEQRKEEWRGESTLATDLAWAWIELGDARQGLAVLDAAATAIGTDARAHWTRGRCLAELDRHGEALAEYDAALATEADDPQVLLDSAFALRALDRGDQALDRARRSWRAGGLEIWGQFRLVDLLGELGAPADAGEVLDELTQTDAWKGDRAAAVELAVRLLERNEPKKAIAVLDGVLADVTWLASADANTAITWRALSLARAGDTARAEADLETLDARGARAAEPGMRALAGFAEFAVGRRDAALAYFDGIADSVRDDLRVQVLLQTGMALVQLGRLTEAVAPLRRAHSLAALPGGDAEAAGQAALFLEMALGGADGDEQACLLDEAGRLLPAGNVQGRALLDLRRANRAVGGQRWDDVLALTDGLAGRLASLDRPVAHLLRGLALAQRSRFDEALNALDEVVAASEVPQSFRASALAVRGAVHRARGDYAHARADFVDASALSDDPDQQRQLRIWVAGCDLTLGEPEAALAALDRLAGDDPPAAETPEYWDLRANTLWSLNRFGDAVAAADRLAELDPSKRRFARFAKLGADLQQLDWSSLEDAVTELAEAPPGKASALDWMITAYMRAFASRTDASEALGQARKLDPAAYESAFGRVVRMMIAVAQGDLASFDAAAPADETQEPTMRGNVHLLRAQTLLARKGNEQLAIGEFARVAQLAAENPQPVSGMQAVVALAYQAEVQTTLDDVDAARKALDEAEGFLAHLQDPGALRPLVAIARVPMLLKSEGVDRALAELASADAHLDRLPRELQAAAGYLRGVLLRLRGDDEMAMVALGRAATLDPTEVSILRGLAEVQIDLGDHDAAIATIEKAEKALDHAADVSQRIDLDRLHSIALRRIGHLEAALERARQAVERDPDSGPGWMTLGDAYQALDRLDPAAKAYRRGWDLSRGDKRTAASCLVGLSRALILADKNRAALDALGSSHHGQRVTEIAKTYGAVSFNRAVALLRCGDEDRAMRELTAAANAEHPASEAAELAGRMARRRAREGSWLGFWFLDRDSGRARQLAGAALLVLLTITTVVTIATRPKSAGWAGCHPTATTGS